MTPEQAIRVLDAAADCATKTQALFSAIEDNVQGNLPPDVLVTIVDEYITAKEAFDSAIMTRGVI